MVGDIAVVRVEDNFNFKRKILGCDFIPQKIGFNNLTLSYEKSGTIASIAGWGTTNRFTNVRFSFLLVKWLVITVKDLWGHGFDSHP